MPTLAEVLLSARNRDDLVADCAALVESHVAGLSGLRGMGVKTGLSMLRSARPDIVARAARHLLPDFAQALDPLYQRFRAGRGGDFSAFLRQHEDDAIRSLLAVTDRRAATSHNAVAKGVYQRLRRSAETELRAALPALSKVLQRYVS